MPSSAARRFRRGKTPGIPRQMGQTRVLGGAPYSFLQEQKIFVSVFSSA
jgi:hypothetical protein